MTNTAVSNRMLDKIVSTIGDLPATPAIIATLMNMTANINTDLDMITRAVTADQSLSAKILKMSNSSFYGRSREVTTLKEAIIILGFMTLHSMVIATATQGLYQKSSHADISSKLWEHAFACAIASRLLARTVRYPYIEEAFTIGLLHDIGKLVLTQKMTDDYRDIICVIEESHGCFADAEMEKFGFTHADVGAILLEKWSFPEELVETIRHHHNPPDTRDELSDLIRIIHLGDYLAKKLDIGFNDHKVDDIASLPEAQALNLDAATLEQVEITLKEHFQNEREFFKL